MVILDESVWSLYQRSQQWRRCLCLCAFNCVHALVRDEPHSVKPPDSFRRKQPCIVSKALQSGHKILVSVISMVEIVFFRVEVFEGAVCEQTAPCGGRAADVAEECELWPVSECHCCVADAEFGGDNHGNKYRGKRQWCG